MRDVHQTSAGAIQYGRSWAPCAAQIAVIVTEYFVGAVDKVGGVVNYGLSITVKWCTSHNTVVYIAFSTSCISLNCLIGR